MTEPSRILVVGRHEGTTHKFTRALEADGHIVTSTLSEATALDLAGSSYFDAVVIGGGVSHADIRYLGTQIQRKNSSTAIIVVHGPESVLSQLRQAFKERASAEST